MAKFPSSEHLKSKRVLEKVYNEGALLKKYPFRLKYLKHAVNEGSGVQIVISIPKRYIKTAVERNRLRRKIKEIYRLNKRPILDKVKDQNEGLALFLIYTSKEKEPFAALDKKLKELLITLEKNI